MEERKIKLKKIKQLLFTLLMTFMFSVGITSVKANIDDTQLDRDRFDGIFEVINTENGTYLFQTNRFLMNGMTAPITTLPAWTIAPSPMRAPGSTMHFIPIHA